MKKLVKLFALVCLLVAVCCTVAGYGGEDKIHAPFKDSDCKGEDLDSVVAQLRDAGFTNIETAPEDTAVSFNANQVISVKIGSNAAYNTANAWNPDVEIVVKYYQFTGEPDPQTEPLTVTMDIETTGEDGKPAFTITTNLPDDTLLSVEFSLDTPAFEGQDDYFEQRELTVHDGKASTDAFSCGGEPLMGDYRFGVAMLPSEQSGQVLDAVGGTSGSNLAGPLVQDSGSSKYIITSISYHSPCERPVKERAKDVDGQIMSICSAAESEYAGLVDALSSGNLSLVEIYRMADDVKKSLADYNYKQLSRIDGDGLDGFGDYKAGAELYIYTMMEVCDKVKDYADDGKTSTLSELQDSLENVSTYLVFCVACRLAFLESAGFSTDEISEMAGG